MEGRFSGKAGEEYELVKVACPHFDLLESKVPEVIKGKYKRFEGQEIKVLEIGCGSGITTDLILSADERTTVVAVDNEMVMIKQAKEHLRDFMHAGRLEVVETDALEYLRTLKEGSFDVFASGYTVHNFEKDYRKSVLIEIFRVLKTGGLFVNADKYALDDEEEHKESLRWQMNLFNTAFSKINRPDLKDVWTKHYLDDDVPELIMKEGESSRFMESIGFKNIKQIFRAHMDAVVVAEK
ncbi:MAG: class I SAM-dependent methyltransferase [archaeon]